MKMKRIAIMSVQQRMTQDVRHCAPQDSLADAARVLWENDCGFTPVLDSDRRLRGILTDRDICMAAYTSGRRLHDLTVADVMTVDVTTIGPQESIQDAEEAMRTRGVRRLPVIDEERRVIGVLSCNDICRWFDDGGSNGPHHHDATHFVRTMAIIGKPRGTAAAGSSAPNASTPFEPPTPLEAPTVRQRDTARTSKARG